MALEVRVRNGPTDRSACGSQAPCFLVSHLPLDMGDAVPYSVRHSIVPLEGGHACPKPAI